MENKLNEIDDILASFEDIMHGTNGEDCTKARKLLIEVQNQLKLYNLHGVVWRSEQLKCCNADCNEPVASPDGVYCEFHRSM